MTKHKSNASVPVTTDLATCIANKIQIRTKVLAIAYTYQELAIHLHVIPSKKYYMKAENTEVKGSIELF